MKSITYYSICFLVVIMSCESNNNKLQVNIYETSKSGNQLTEITDFNNITNISFTTPGGNMMRFEYKVLAFDKVVDYNGNYIVKLFAECIDNGIWLAQKYMLKD